MTCNVGGIDRILRAIVGLGLLSLAFVGPQTAWGWLGIVPLATAVFGWCPPYALLGFSTCAVKPDGKTGNGT
jgi:membrane protein implicated in regulation of membrane protease activity